MRIKCLHGYFKFEEQRPGQVSEFMSLFKFPLVAKSNYYTFSFLSAAKDYSVIGATYLGALATATFEGEPWEVMRENSLVYNFNTNTVVPISTISTIVKVIQSDNYFLSAGLILPGSVMDDGSRVKDYSAWFSPSTMQFKYSDIAV